MSEAEQLQPQESQIATCVSQVHYGQQHYRPLLHVATPHSLERAAITAIRLYGLRSLITSSAKICIPAGKLCNIILSAGSRGRGGLEAASGSCCLQNLGRYSRVLLGPQSKRVWTSGGSLGSGWFRDAIQTTRLCRVEPGQEREMCTVKTWEPLLDF